jgi:hypothetical protein
MHSRIGFTLLAMAVIGGCRTASIPKPIWLNEPDLYTDAVIKQNAQRCILHLNELAADALTAAKTSDGFAVAGGITSVLGGLLATIIPALQTHDTPDAERDTARTGTIISGAVAAVGGIFAVLVSVVDPPSQSTKRHTDASKRYYLSKKMVDANLGMDSTDPNYKVVIGELNDCQAQ